jgi:hypothetical protein
VVLDDIPINKIPVVPDAQKQQVISHTPISVRHSKRVSLPLEIFSPSLCSILFTNFDEPNYYEEAMQVDTKKKWELGMREEMDSLL